MDENDETISDDAREPGRIPPVLPGFQRSRWWIHLILLSIYPLLLGSIGYLTAEKKTLPLLPETKLGLMEMAGIEMAIFAAIFLLAWTASRAGADQLFLRWRGGWRPVVRGIAYSVALRVGLAVILITVLLITSSFVSLNTKNLEQLRPKVEAVIDPVALKKDPLYFVLVLTVISFVVAGLREELWRAGMLAGCQAVFPAHFATRLGQAAAVGLTAIVFGLGHAPQGWGAIALTTLLGMGLGAIILWHRSLWDAALAHGFFDATTFLFLWILSNYLHWTPG